jgi:SWI/SNF-related matrix-associated actin-dependent regulator 1 of chromatin subfamily A
MDRRHNAGEGIVIRIVSLTSTLHGIRADRFSPALREEAKATPGLVWNPAERAWCGYSDAVAACLSRMRSRGLIVHGDITPPSWGRPLDREGEGLRDYQRVGVSFLCAQAKEGALLADDMGCGKSRQALAALAKLPEPAVIVCPSFVREVWLREIKKWRPDLVDSVAELSGTKPPRENPDPRARVVLVHYDIIHAWASRLQPGTVVFDECHYLQSERSRRSLACRTLARAAKARIGLSGTPMTSRPRDLWNVVDTLSEGRFGRPFDFFIAHADARRETIHTRGGDKTVWKTDGASRLDELRERMSYFMLRRTKSDVALELPPRTRQVIEVEVKRAYRAPLGDALRSDREARQALDKAADGKLDQAVSMIASHVADERKIVVFCHRRAIAEGIADSLRTSGVDARVITGAIPPKERTAIVDAAPQVLTCTMDATAVGIDLSYADVAVFVELDWVPSKLAQCEARLHRFGQKNPVLIQYMIALSTADELIREAVIEKLATFEAGIGKTDDGLRTSLEGKRELDVLRNLYEKITRMEKHDGQHTRCS